MAETTILVEVSEHVATVTLNRPDKLNALNRDTLVALESAFAELEADANVAVVILTGSGEKAFAAGADIAEMSELSPVEATAYALLGQRVLLKIENLSKPVIAAINGFALGGGCELAMAAHLRIAAEHASFGQPEVKLGLICGFAGTQRLTRLIGKPRALELLLTGDRISASRALEVGLINRMVAGDQLMTEARSLAADIQKVAPLAVSHTLEAVQTGLEAGFVEGSRLEAALFGLLFSTEDMKEGTEAFLKKRSAKFGGR